MRFKLAISTALLLATTQACTRAQKPVPAPWLLTFDGKSSNDLAHDKRFPGFLRSHVSPRRLIYWTTYPTAPSKDALDFLSGPPDDVHVTSKRYLTAAACVPHDCTDRGLLWVDTTTGATIFAASVFSIPAPIATNRAHLWLFTNTPLQISTLPPSLTAAVAQWSGEPNGDDTHTIITDVTIVQPDGTQTKAVPADVHTWTSTTIAPVTAGK